MRILAVSDEVVKGLYSANVADLTNTIDLLLGCGDLPYSYMEYLVTTLQVRHACFVHGNHDTVEYSQDGGSSFSNGTLSAPGGWVNVDRQVYIANGVIVAGLEGCLRYKPDAPYQYSESQMRARAVHLMLKLFFNRARYGRYLDILITHSPPAGIHDGPDTPHQGFAVFLTLMQHFRPRLLLHGHKHHYGPSTWRTTYQQTEVINVCPSRMLQLDGDEVSCSISHQSYGLKVEE